MIITKYIYNKFNEKYVIDIVEDTKNHFDFLLHKENDLTNEAYLYTSFFNNHIAIIECISHNQRKGLAEILFNEMLYFLNQYYTDKVCKYIIGWLSERDRQNGNWFKSIPFYKKMFIQHPNLFVDLCFYNYNEPSQIYTSDYILNNIDFFEHILLYFKFKTSF